MSTEDSTNKAKPWLFKKGQKPWNKGTGGCTRGHDPALWSLPPSGVWYCRGCRRENGAKYRAANKKTIHLKNRVARYGMTIDELQRMWDSQRGACAICASELHRSGEPLHGPYRIDHCHHTGIVRGLLCAACNTGIGLLQDSPEIMMKAARYVLDAGKNEDIRGTPQNPSRDAAEVYRLSSKAEGDSRR